MIEGDFVKEYQLQIHKRLMEVAMEKQREAIMDEMVTS